MRRRALAPVAILVTAALALPAASAPAKTKPVLFSKECASAHYKPEEILIACADARSSFHALEWVRWGARDAFARGRFLHPDCPPSTPIVACRKNTTDNATVHLYRPRFCPRKGRRFFTRLRLRDPEADERFLRSIKLDFECRFVR